VRRALEEELPWGDLTTEALVPEDSQSRGLLVAREGGVICGLKVAAAVFTSPSMSITSRTVVGLGLTTPESASTMSSPSSRSARGA